MEFVYKKLSCWKTREEQSIKQGFCHADSRLQSPIFDLELGLMVYIEFLTASKQIV